MLVLPVQEILDPALDGCETSLLCNLGIYRHWNLSTGGEGGEGGGGGGGWGVGGVDIGTVSEIGPLI